MDCPDPRAHRFRNPITTTDAVLEVYDANDNFLGLGLIRRAHDPFAGRWALPGGYQEWMESLEDTAIRETCEEACVNPSDLELVAQLRAYSGPERDPRNLNSVGYVIRTRARVWRGGDDAADARVFPISAIPHPLAFDHSDRVREYLAWRGERCLHHDYIAFIQKLGLQRDFEQFRAGRGAGPWRVS